MNKRDLDKLVRWAVDSDLEKFGEDAYGITGTLLRYDHMTTYGLKRQDCFRCDKND